VGKLLLGLKPTPTRSASRARPRTASTSTSEVPRVDFQKLTDDRLGEPSAAIRARVERARERQRVRFEGSHVTCNADMGTSEVRQICKLDQTG